MSEREKVVAFFSVNMCILSTLTHSGCDPEGFPVTSIALLIFLCVSATVLLI